LLGSFFIHHFEENNMVKKIKVLGKATFLALSLAAMIVGAALAVDSVTLLNYQIDFLGFEQTGDTSTWRYAVTANGDEANGLSHWTLELGSCYEIIAPTNNYSTPTNLDVCTDGTYSCQSSNYTVVQGIDPTTGLSGIKFEDPSSALASGNQVTHIFEITVQYDGDHVLASEIGAGIKAGQGEQIGAISGPGCVPTAVSLVSFGAGKSSNLQVGAFLAVVGAFALVGGVVVQRNRKKSN
jgi:hypothetical protein